MEEELDSKAKAKRLWKQRQKITELDRRDFQISRNIASGNGISNDAAQAWGKDRAIVNTPILEPAVNAISYRFESNPFNFQIPQAMQNYMDSDELLAALSKALREICWDGISYVLVYHDNSGKIKFRVLDNMNVVWGKCKLATGQDCKEALYVDKISKQEAEESYPDLKALYPRSGKSIADYSGPKPEGGEYEEVTYWERDGNMVNVTKFIGGEAVDETALLMNRLPIIRICGKKVYTEGHENWRGIPYPVRDLLITLTYMSSLLQERIATAPTFNFWVANESLKDNEMAKQNARMNGQPRACAYYGALDNSGNQLPGPVKVDKSAGIEELSVHIGNLTQTINSIIGSVAGSEPAAGTETAESVLLRKENKENATDEFLRNLLAGARGIAKVTEQYFIMLGVQASIMVSESIFEKAKQQSDNQKLIAFASFMSHNPQNMDFADALLPALDLNADNETNLRNVIEMRKQKEQQSIEQLMRQGQMQAMQLQQAQGQVATLQKQLQDSERAKFEMESDSKARILIEEMKLNNALAIKKMDLQLEYDKLGLKAGTDNAKLELEAAEEKNNAVRNEIEVAKIANKQQERMEAAFDEAIQHPTDGGFR